VFDRATAARSFVLSTGCLGSAFTVVVNVPKEARQATTATQALAVCFNGILLVHRIGLPYRYRRTRDKHETAGLRQYGPGPTQRPSSVSGCFLDVEGGGVVFRVCCAPSVLLGGDDRSALCPSRRHIDHEEPASMRKTLTTAMGAIGALATALVCTFVLADPASAQSVTVFQGEDFAFVNNYTLLYVEDVECDGQNVYAHFIFRDGTAHRRFDSDGCEGAGEFFQFDREIRELRVCETGSPVLCSPFKPT
jgi:hypothetical protein